MPIPVACSCGARFNLRDEYAGRTLKCPTCQRAIQAPESAMAMAPAGAAVVGDESDGAGEIPLAPPVAPPPLHVDYAVPAPLQQFSTSPFDRDRFLLRQKAVAINQKYYVWDEAGRTILFIERPRMVLRSLLAAFGAIATFAVIAILCGLTIAVIFPNGPRGNDVLMGTILVVTTLIAITASIAVAVWASPRRHVTFYTDENKTQSVLSVTQDNKFQVIWAYYTVRTPDGTILATLTKNYLYNFFRKRWYVNRPDGSQWLMAKEDSIILSLLRRVLGNLGAFIRTNFIFCEPGTDEVIGEFNRKFTLLDRYVLDLASDPDRTLDRRVAVALGVMLDTGERR